MLVIYIESEHAVIRAIEKICKTFDLKGVVGMISIDLSKASDCMPHDLLIVKLNAYGFGAQESKANCKFLLK